MMHYLLSVYLFYLVYSVSVIRNGHVRCISSYCFSETVLHRSVLFIIDQCPL